MELLRRGRARADFERFAAVQADDLLRTAYLMTGVPRPSSRVLSTATSQTRLTEIPG